MGLLLASRRAVMAGASGGSGHIGGYLLRDVFSGTNGTNFTAHAMDVGPGWTQLSGGFQLNGSGQAVPTGTGICLDISSAGQADMDASVTVQASALDNYAGLVVRAQDASNFFFAGLDFASGGLGFFLGQISAGAFNSRASFARAPSISTPYTMRLMVKGNLFTGFLNGVQEWTFTSSVLNTKTNAGLRNNSGTSVVYSNFAVAAP